MEEYSSSRALDHNSLNYSINKSRNANFFFADKKYNCKSAVSGQGEKPVVSDWLLGTQQDSRGIICISGETFIIFYATLLKCRIFVSLHQINA